MNIVQDIIDFFIRLIRGRVDQVGFQAKSKMMGYEARAKAEAAKRFNQAIDGSVDKAKQAARGGPGPDKGKR